MSCSQTQTNRLKGETTMSAKKTSKTSKTEAAKAKKGMETEVAPMAEPAPEAQATEKVTKTPKPKAEPKPKKVSPCLVLPSPRPGRIHAVFSISHYITVNSPSGGVGGRTLVMPNAL